jgi:undecaprenyl-diphosphatase
MTGDSITGFDTRLLLAFREPGDPDDPFGPLWLEEAVRDLTALGSTSFLLLLVIASVGYLILLSKWRTALFLAVSIGGGVAAGFVLKAGFDRARPDLVAAQAEVFTSSFPSGHAMSAAVTFLTLGALLAGSHSRRRVRAFLIVTAALLTVLVGLSRVYLGLHWPSDVLAGWAAGAAWALAAWLLARKLRRRKEIEASS